MITILCPMAQARAKRRYKMKICTIGEEAVGKTSLIRRFVADKFEGEYIRTIGTLISKKTVKLEDPMGQPLEIDAVLWDIMGRQGFMELLKDAYFYKANGVLAVADITRGDTLQSLNGWLQGVHSAAGDVSATILVNKSDLEDEVEVKKKDIVELGRAHEAPWYLTSAKTGENVALAFEGLIRMILQEPGSVPPSLKPLTRRS